MDQPIFEKVLNVIKDLVADNGTDAVSLLKADHRKVEGLFKEYEKSQDNDDKRAILQQIIKELNVHATVEESKVYPILEHEDEEGSNEAYEEHHLVKVILDELGSMDVASPLTDAKVKALSELVKHHVQEEELELLPELQSMDIDLEELGSVIVAEKGRLKAKGEDTPDSKDVSTKNLKKVGEANAVSTASIKKSKDKKAPVKSPVAKAKAIAKEVTSKTKAVTKKPVAKTKAIAKKVVSEVKTKAKEAKDKLSSKKPVVKKTVAKKAVAKPVAKKPVAKKAAVKPAVKKATAKPVAKKPVAKKAAAKPAVKKVTAKPVAKKPVAKKAASKPTPITKKTTAKKPLARKKAS